jgi:pilus assembly protein CpaC
MKTRAFTLLVASGLGVLPRAALAQPPRTPASAPAPAPAAAAADASRSGEIVMAVGENRTISAQDVINYSEGAKDVVDVKLTSDKSQFVLVGVKPGSSSLLLIRRNGTEINHVIRVYARSPEAVEAELAQLLGPLGVRIRRVGGRVFVEGSVASEADVERVRQVSSLYGGQVESLVTLSQGAGASPTAAGTNIRIDFFFVQYRKDASYSVGIGWPGQLGGAAVQSNFAYDFVNGTTAAQTAVLNHPLPTLDVAQKRGWAKVLKQATVITTNGVEASVQNGGEQNFPVAAGLTGSIQKIEFGTAVTVLPRFDPGTHSLEIKVNAEVSDLVAPVRATTLPGRQTAHLNTHVNMKLGQSLVLSGIRTRSEVHTVSGLPGLSDIPILGLLFGNHSNEESEVEGAVFIIPSVVEATSRPVAEHIREAMERYENFAGHMDDVNEFQKVPK